MGFRARVARAVLLVACLAPSTSWAEPTAADRENARAYMAAGREKRSAGDLKGALKAFQAANEIMHVPTTGIEVARTEAATGALIEAREDALQVARSPSRPDDPAPFAEARAAAQKLANELEPRIPSLRLSLKGATDAQVSVDGEVLPSAALGLPRRVDPGAHVLVAKSGSTERRVNVDVQEGESKEVSIDLATASPSTNPPPVTELPPQEPVKPPPPPPIERPSSSSGLVIVGGVLVGVGGVGLVVGAITGVMSLSETSTIKQQCMNNVCPPSQSGAIADARNLGIVSDIGFIAGGVVAALGITLAVVGATAHKSPKVSVGFGPTGVLLSGSF